MFSSRKENDKVNKLHEIALTVLVDKTNDLFEDRHPKKSCQYSCHKHTTI